MARDNYYWIKITVTSDLAFIEADDFISCGSDVNYITGLFLKVLALTVSKSSKPTSVLVDEANGALLFLSHLNGIRVARRFVYVPMLGILCEQVWAAVPIRTQCVLGN